VDDEQKVRVFRFAQQRIPCFFVNRCVDEPGKRIEKGLAGVFEADPVFLDVGIGL
jgi:hypothetical protein